MCCFKARQLEKAFLLFWFVTDSVAPLWLFWTHWLTVVTDTFLLFVPPPLPPPHRRMVRLAEQKGFTQRSWTTTSVWHHATVKSTPSHTVMHNLPATGSTRGTFSLNAFGLISIQAPDKEPVESVCFPGWPRGPSIYRTPTCHLDLLLLASPELGSLQFCGSSPENKSNIFKILTKYKCALRKIPLTALKHISCNSRESP